MYHHLRGNLYRLTPSEAVVEAGGVGYKLEVPFPTYKALEDRVGSEVVLFVFPYFREESQRLFGFTSEDDRDFFRLVVGGRGCGPSHALAEILQKVRGVGRKNAERLIVELREKLPGKTIETPGESPGGEAETARLALQGLGYSRGDAVSAVEKAKKALPEGNAADWIKYALQTRR